jgi:hypothetical protein
MSEIQTRYFDHGDEGAVIVRHQLIGDTIDAIKELHNTGLHGTKDVKYLGSVPGIVIEEYCKQRGITVREFVKNPEHARAFLNDPAHKDFRVWPGKV